MGATHGLSGIAAGFGVGLLAPDVAVGLLCGVVGGLAAYTPDLDHPSATAVRKLWLLGSLICWVLRTVSSLLTDTKHRGFTHSLLFALLVAGLSFWLAAVWLPLDVAAVLAGAALAGVLAALLGDAVTRAGLDHVLWPWEWRLAIPKPLRLRTGGVAERWLVLPLMCVLCAVGFGLVVGVGGL